MSKLVTTAEQFIPELIAGYKRSLAKVIDDFNSIKSFEDIERIYFLNFDLSHHTYHSYLTSVKTVFVKIVVALTDPIKHSFTLLT